MAVPRIYRNDPTASGAPSMFRVESESGAGDRTWDEIPGTWDNVPGNFDETGQQS